MSILNYRYKAIERKVNLFKLISSATVALEEPEYGYESTNCADRGTAVQTKGL